MKTVLILQNDPVDTPGVVPAILAARGVGVRIARPFAGDLVPPTLAGYGGLILLGGAMGAGDRAAYPFLDDEVRLLRSAVEAGRPVLGLCLGGQLSGRLVPHRIVL